jgi:hypothetical protein
MDISPCSSYICKIEKLENDALGKEKKMLKINHPNFLNCDLIYMNEEDN